jgi:hypothetical protein
MGNREGLARPMGFERGNYVSVTFYIPYTDGEGQNLQIGTHFKRTMISDSW